MASYIAGRFLALGLNLFLISLFLFFTLRMLPGDPTLTILTDTAQEEQIQAFRELHGLDKSVPVQYVNWLTGVFQGDMGISLRTGLPVATEFFNRLPITLEIMFLSFAFTSIIGISFGILSATRQDTVWDYGIRFIAIAGISIPNFLLLTLLLILPARLFGYAPPFGAIDFFDRPLANLELLIPPTFLLAVSSSAVLMRLTRTAMLDILRQDFMRTARSKGLAERTVIYRHGLRNALPMVITYMGLQMGVLLGGSVILESILALPGMGTWGLQALQAQDTPIFLLFALYASGMLMLVNLIVDLLYGVFDPRIAY